MHVGRRGRGFTLVELIVSVVVLAVLAAVSVATFDRHASTARAAAIRATAVQIRDAIASRAAADDLSADAEVAKLVALPGGIASGLGVSFDGKLAYQAPVGGLAGTLHVAGANGRTVSVTLPVLAGLPPALSGVATGGPVTLTAVVSLTTGTSGPVSVAFDPTGRFLATANLGGNISTFLIAGDNAVQPVGRYSVGSEPRGVAFSRDGRLVATADFLGQSVTVMKVDQATGALTSAGTTALGAGTSPRSVAFSPTADLLAVALGGTGQVRIFRVDAATGALSGGNTLTVPGGSSTAVGFTADGLFVINKGTVSSAFPVNGAAGTIGVPVAPGIVTSGGSARPSSTGMLTVTRLGSDYRSYAIGGDGSFTPLAVTATDAPNAWWSEFSPDGRYLATANTADGSVTLNAVDPITGVVKQIAESPVGQHPESVAFSPNGALLATADYNSHTVTVLRIE